MGYANTKSLSQYKNSLKAEIMNIYQWQYISIIAINIYSHGKATFVSIL